MSLSGSKFAYEDCFDILNTALERTQGCRLAQPSESACNMLRMRIHQARKLERDDNAKTFERGHPMHGRSVFDKLIVRIRNEDEVWYVYVEHGGVDTTLIEPLGDKLLEGPEPTTLPAPEAELEAEFEEVVVPKQIEHVKRRV